MLRVGVPRSVCRASGANAHIVPRRRTSRRRNPAHSCRIGRHFELQGLRESGRGHKQRRGGRHESVWDHGGLPFATGTFIDLRRLPVVTAPGFRQRGGACVRVLFPRADSRRPTASTRVDRSGTETANARQRSCTPYMRDLSSGTAPASCRCAIACQRRRQRIHHRPVQTPPRAVSVACYEPGRASQTAPAMTESSAPDCIFPMA